ncbi:hypothetical protein LTR86_009297 [Recurvomyces mirabilis]|nr:hypothetical protein LTR86_009297 [Recurvomyces mirabilis]
MASDPVPTPAPYLDPQNIDLGEQAGALLNGKQLNDLTPAQARKLFDQLQTPSPLHPDVSISEHEITTAHGKMKTFVYRRKHIDLHEKLPFVYHVHGSGWIFGDAFDYTAFVCDIVVRTGFAVVFSQYSLAPETRFPVQEEQCLEVLEHVLKHGTEFGVKGDEVVLSGDSAGGQLVTAISILSHERKLNLPIVHQVLWHPLVDSSSTGTRFSEFLFQNGPLLTTPFIQEAISDYFGTDTKDRTSILTSPILMSTQQVKEFMPSTTIITGQADWLRDQGQDFGQLSQTAGVPCAILQEVACLHICEVFNKSRTSPTVELVMIGVCGKIKEVMSFDQKVDSEHQVEHEKAENGKPAKRRKR